MELKWLKLIGVLMCLTLLIVLNGIEICRLESAAHKYTLLIVLNGIEI